MMNSLYYEIENCAYIEAHLMGEDQEHCRHTVADICQPGNRDRVDSVIGLALAELRMPAEAALANPHAREYIVACVLADWLGFAKPAGYNGALWVRQNGVSGSFREPCYEPF